MAESETGKENRLTPLTLFQSLYLTITFFSSNDLVTYAASCSFGFILSFLPIVTMILVILIRFMRAAPQLVIDALSFNPLITNFIQLENIATSIQQIKKITNFEIILAIATIWMSRRFFSSLIRSMKRVFKQTYRVQKATLTILIVIAEAFLTIVLSMLVFVLVSFRTIVRFPMWTSLQTAYPALMESFTNLIVTTVPYILIFIGSILVYKFVSRTKPSLLLCIFPALGCTFSMWGLRKLMRIFININRYNTIYGVLSNAVVLILEVYFFFLIFLFFAQYLFVNQFFDTLILGELYTLPHRDETKPKSMLKRLLFIRPDTFLLDKTNVRVLKKGEYIYHQGDFDSTCYYIVKGEVFIFGKGAMSYVSKGGFFGEEACMLDGVRSEDAIANTNCEVVKISEELFFDLLQKNPSVAKKSLSQISTYFSKFYGRNDDYTL